MSLMLYDRPVDSWDRYASHGLACSIEARELADCIEQSLPEEFGPYQFLHFRSEKIGPRQYVASYDIIDLYFLRTTEIDALFSDEYRLWTPRIVPRQLIDEINKNDDHYGFGHYCIFSGITSLRLGDSIYRGRKPRRPSYVWITCNESIINTIDNSIVKNEIGTAIYRALTSAIKRRLTFQFDDGFPATEGVAQRVGLTTPRRPRGAKKSRRPPDERLDLPHAAELKELVAEGAQAKLAGFRCCRCPCGGTLFTLERDETSGVARRRCTACRKQAYIADSREFWSEAEPTAWACAQCGSAVAALGIGISTHDAEPSDSLPGDEEALDWLYIAARCEQCGAVQFACDWKLACSGSVAKILSRL